MTIKIDAFERYDNTILDDFGEGFHRRRRGKEQGPEATVSTKSICTKRYSTQISIASPFRAATSYNSRRSLK